MKIEYLLVKKKDDFCASVDEFKNLLLSNRRITMDDEHITVSKVCFKYMLKMTDVNWKKKKETVFYFSVSIGEQEHVADIEEFDNLLRRINNEYGRPFAINTIWDDVSIYYTNKLYPRMVEVENIVRNVIYRFMINTAGSLWFSNTSPDDFKVAVKKTAEKNQENLLNEDQLYFADFIQLGWFFFASYSMKQLGPNAIEELKKILNDKDEENRDKNINDFLLSYEYKSNWDRYFADKIEVENFSEKWDKLYAYRNSVAHAKRINGKEFSDANKLIDEIKKAFEASLEHVDQVKLSEEEAEVVQEVAQKTIGPAAFSIKLPGVATTVSALGKAASQVASEVDYTGLGSGLLQVGDATKALGKIKIGTAGQLFSNWPESHIQIEPTTGKIVLTDPSIIPKVSAEIIQPFEQPLVTAGSRLLNDSDRSVITGLQNPNKPIDGSNDDSESSEIRDDDEKQKN